MNNLQECMKCRAEMKFGKQIQQRRGHRTTQEQYRTYYTWTKIAGWSLPQGPEKISDIPQVTGFNKHKKWNCEGPNCEKNGPFWNNVSNVSLHRWSLPIMNYQ